MNRFLFYITLILFLGGCAGNDGHQALKRGMRALEKGKYTESIAWFQRSLGTITSNDERSIVLNCMGISYHKLGQKKNARQAFEDAMQANPGAVEPIYNMGIVAFEAGDEDKAMACFEKAALLSEQAYPPMPETVSGRPGSSVKDTRALEFLAIIHSRHRQWDEAQRVLNEASQQAHLSPRILTAQAVTEVKAGNINLALELLQEALEQDAHYAPAIYNLAVINQCYLNKHDQALPLLTEYIRLVPSGPQTDQARLIIEETQNIHSDAFPRPEAFAQMLRNESERAERGRTPLSPATKAKIKAPASTAKTTTTAETAAVSAAQTQPTAAARPAVFPSFEELMQVAEKLEQQGRREAAFNNYLRIARAAERADKISVRNQAVRHAIFLADGNPQATYDLGVYFAERNKKDEAFLYFKAAVNQNVNPHPASLALAKLALEKDEFDTAIVSLKKADQIKPEDPEALWLLAELYDRQLCLSNSAASAYTQFATRFPNDRRVPDALNRLKAMNVDFQPPENTATVQNKKSRSFWQRMFKSSVTNATEGTK